MGTILPEDLALELGQTWHVDVFDHVVTQICISFDPTVGQYYSHTARLFEQPLPTDLDNV